MQPRGFPKRLTLSRYKSCLFDSVPQTKLSGMSDESTSFFFVFFNDFYGNIMFTDSGP